VYTCAVIVALVHSLITVACRCVDIEHKTLFMHAIQLHHCKLYMQLKKGTMTTLVFDSIVTCCGLSC
jgi:hypothetical protein